MAGKTFRLFIGWKFPHTALRQVSVSTGESRTDRMMKYICLLLRRSNGLTVL